MQAIVGWASAYFQSNYASALGDCKVERRADAGRVQVRQLNNCPQQSVCLIGVGVPSKAGRDITIGTDNHAAHLITRKQVLQDARYVAHLRDLRIARFHKPMLAGNDAYEGRSQRTVIPECRERQYAVVDFDHGETAAEHLIEQDLFYIW